MHFTRLLQTRGVFVFVLIILFLFEASLISYRNNEAILQATSSDEALFLLEAVNLYLKFFKTLDPNILHIGFPGPYGHPFWLLLASVMKGAEFAALQVVLVTTLLFLSLKYVAVMFWRETLAFRMDGDCANMLAMALLVSPGLFFYGKIISPEFQTLALVSAGIYFVTRAIINGRAISWLGLFLFFLATYTKLSNLPFFAAAWLATVIIAYRKRGTAYALRLLFISILIFITATLLACAAAGGLSVTVNSILILPTPPAIFRIDHLWQNLTNVPPYTWDQVKLTPLSTAFPILYIAVGAVFLGTILQRRLPSSLAESPLLWILLASAFATLILLLAKSLNYTWYLFGAAIIASLTLLIIASSTLGRRGILMIAAIAIIAGMPATFQNVQAEIRKRALVLDGTARSSALISTAHQLCQGNNAHIILDMLIPAPESSAQHVIPLRDAVRMADVKEDIAHKRPIIFISHEHMLTDFSPAERRLIEPVNAHFAIIRHSAHPGYLFRIGDGCRQK